ncbi:hypothetical protein [Tenacibaculum jejuense]|uniref:Uncharacterized protein n=1 Tax=Tenacibaculum jejuense TaxID=584609 RepID=A0A238UAP5_9FLAO|nr:hypothetical protein [Tenacibaculum jejuense]SNR16251.1 Probable transmembrane protein of unknown function [Tenacibaculum jejuense]
MSTSGIEENEISQPGCLNTFLILIVLLVFIGSLMVYAIFPYFAFFEGDNSSSEKITLSIVSFFALVINLFSIQGMSIINGGQIPEIETYIKKNSTKPLVSWTYNQKEWLIFFKERHKKNIRNSSFFLAGYLLLWTIIYYANEFSPVALLLFSLISIYIILVFRFFAYKTQIKRWQDILSSTQRNIEIYKEAILIDKTYTTPISGYYTRLLDVQIVHKNKQSFIEFTINIFAGKNPRHNIHTRTFLIPEGKLDEATRICSQFTLHERY